jgi:hypothetical protein
MTGLPDRARGLLTEAITAYAARPAYERLMSARRHLDEPLRVAIAGRVKAGKSTLLNALVGRRVAATDAGECTQVVTWYANGTPASAWAHPRSGSRQELVLLPGADSIVVDLGGLRAEDLKQVRVEFPSDWLERMTLIDTPGLGSLTAAAGQRTTDFLAGDNPETGDVDAVLYLLRHLHSSDVDFMEILREAQVGRSTPINAVGVLSRADEVGGGGEDAIEQAHKVATGYREDPRVRSTLHTVTPVAGLLAEAASTLRVDEFTELAALAEAGPAVTTPMLLSVARFVAPVKAVTLTPSVRARLLRRFGLYGVRLSVEAIRRDGLDRDRLADLMRERSGLAGLRRLLLTQFAQRRDVLKADSALRVIDAVTRADPIPAAGKLREQIERIRANAHELAEIRLLTELRTGQVPAPPEESAQMERLLGGEGTATATRLGLPEDAPPDDIAAAIGREHTRWRRVGDNRFTDPVLARAAAVLQRTCEGLSAG